MFMFLVSKHNGPTLFVDSMRVGMGMGMRMGKEGEGRELGSEYSLFADQS